MRRFEDELDMIKALNGAGIQAERYAVALRMVLPASKGPLSSLRTKHKSWVSCTPTLRNNPIRLFAQT
jgi:hypothetical protein